MSAQRSKASRRGAPTRVRGKASYHHGDLHEQLVRAATRLITRDGVANFKVADACRLAGVSVAAPYRHFKDRDAILDAVADAGFARLEAAMSEGATRFEAGSDEAVHAIGMAYVTLARTEPHVFRLMFGRSSADKPPPDEESDPGAHAYGVLIAQVATRLGRAPDHRTVLATAMALWTMVHGLSFLLIDEQLGVTRMDLDVDGMVMAAGTRLLGTFV